MIKQQINLIYPFDNYFFLKSSAAMADTAERHLNTTTGACLGFISTICGAVTDTTLALRLQTDNANVTNSVSNISGPT